VFKFNESVKQKLKLLMPSHDNIAWEQMERLFTKREFKKKQNWINEFEESDKVAIVESGLMRIFMFDKKGDEKTHSFVVEGGATLNHFWVYEKTPSPVIIQTIEDTVLYESTHSKITAISKQYPCWDELHRNLLAQAFMYKLKREMFFVMYDATERLQHLDEFPYVDPNRIPKGHLASFLGIKAQSFSRLNKK
jgi:hypothetical protein